MLSSLDRRRTLTKLTIALGSLALSTTAVGVASVKAEPAGATVTIKDFMYSPADLAAKIDQPATITNNDGFSHTVTAKDGTFDIDVPPNGSVTLKVSKAGSFPYSCTYHPGQHNPATINVS